MKTRDANVIDALNVVTEELSSQSGFFRDGNIRCARGDHGDGGRGRFDGFLYCTENLAVRVILCCLRKTLKKGVFFRTQAGDKNIVSTLPDGVHDIADLGRAFSRTEDDFSSTRATFPVMVDDRVSQILEKTPADADCGRAPSRRPRAEPPSRSR